MPIDLAADAKKAQFDLLIKLCVLDPDNSIIYPHQLREMALFARSAEEHLNDPERRGYLPPSLIDKLAHRQSWALYHENVALRTRGKSMIHFLDWFEEHLHFDKQKKVWTGHLSRKWQESRPVFAEVEKYYYQNYDTEFLLRGAYQRIIEHWHVACAGAEATFNELAEKCPEKGMQLRAVHKKLNGLQDERETDRQQRTFLSPNEMVDIAGVRYIGSDTKKLKLHSFVESRVQHYQKMSEQPSEFEWRRELQAYHNPPTILSRIVETGQSLATTVLDFRNAIAKRISQRSTDKKITAAPAVDRDFKHAVLDPGDNGEFAGLRNAIEQGNLLELVVTLKNPPLKALPLASVLSGGLCAEDLLHPLRDGRPIIVHHFNKIADILTALQTSRQVLSPEEWRRKYTFGGKQRTIIDCAEGCPEEIADAIFDPRNFTHWKNTEIGQFWLDSPTSIKQHISPDRLRRIVETVEFLAGKQKQGGQNYQQNLRMKDKPNNHHLPPRL